MQRIYDILILQQREIEQIDKTEYIQRASSLSELDKNIIKVVIGPRRAGKSYFTINELSKIKNFGYINFDDEFLINVKNYDDLITSVNSIYKNPKILFLDEIQNLPGWELFINRLQRQGKNIIISGSNSNLLSKELVTHLTGRYIKTLIFPFSFDEYIRFYKNNLTSSEKKSYLNDYFQNGGFPEPLVKNLNYREYLKTLVDSIIFKDIIKRYRIGTPQYLNELSKYIISNYGSLLSYQNMTRMTGIKSVHTIEKYLNYLEEAFIVFKINGFSFKVKEQIKSKKKIYLIDNGFINAKSFQVSPNIGKRIENLVAIELKKKEIAGELNFYYYRNSQGHEVDFVIRKENKIVQLIQVCSYLDNEEIKNRETRALLNASNDLECKNMLIITIDYESEEEIKWFGKKGNITYIPLWKWLTK